MYLVEFHIYVAYISNNYKWTSTQTVYWKFCYVQLCKRRHMANYNITISPLQIPNTSYAEVPLPVYDKKH